MSYAAQPPPAAPQPPSVPTNGFSVTALVTGIVGLILAWIPFIGFLGFILGVIAIVFGGVGLARTRRNPANSKGLAISGLVLGVIAFVVSLAVWITTANEIDKTINTGTGGAQNEAPVQPAQEENAASPQATTSLAFGETYTWPGGEKVTVSAPTDVTAEDPFLAPEGGRVAAVDVTVVNNGDDEFNVADLALTAQHDGRVAQSSIVAGDPFPNVQLPPGGQTTFTAAYDVGDSPGELRISVQPNYFATTTVYYTGKF